MAADLGLVAHAAERHAHELAAGGARDRLAERRLADARRSDEAEDRALQLADQALHGEVLEDALLHLLEAVVILLEDLLGVVDVELVLGVLVPRQRDEPVDVVAHDGRLGGHRRHHLELLQLLLRLLARLGRHLLLLDLLLELLDLVLELVLLAELLLDRPHLLVEVVLLLGLLHLLLDPGSGCASRPRGSRSPTACSRAPSRGARPDSSISSSVCLSSSLMPRCATMRVGEPRRIVDRRHRHDHLGRDLLVQLDVVLEGRVDRCGSAPRPRWSCSHDLLDLLGLDQEELGVVDVARRCARASCPRPAPSRCRRAGAAAARPCRACRRGRCRPRPGSFVLASFWAASRMNFCLFIASSSARIDFWRPTKSGTTMCGKTMMSRSGSSGTRNPLRRRPSRGCPSCRCGRACGSSFRRPRSGGLGGLLVEDERLLAVGDDLLGDQHFLDVGLARGCRTSRRA